MPSDRYVLTPRPTSGGDLDLTRLRGLAIADAYARSRRAAGDDVLFVPAVDDTAAARERLDALGIDFDWDRVPAAGDAAIERWAQWLLERLDGAGLLYLREGEGWRLRSGKLHGESERRLGELAGWSEAALAEQRELLEHVDDPGDGGNELEQSLSKLAAAGWKVDAKKDKGPPTVHYAAGDMPLALGDDWRAAGAVHPRLAAALALLLAALPPGERDSAPPAQIEQVVGRLPAVAVAEPGTGQALLDLRTIARALRDAGGLELASGEPLGPVLVHGRFALTAGKPANGADPAAAGDDPSDAGALIAAHGADPVRFALLHAAAPAKPFAGGADVVGYAAAFLEELGKLASERLDGATAASRIDPGDGLRRRLAGWCDTAVERTAENYERLDMHRATRNAVELLARIKDFDARVTEQRGQPAGADLEAIATALALLAQLLAPLAPSAADAVWQQAGRPGRAGDAPWPSAQREPAAA